MVQELDTVPAVVRSRLRLKHFEVFHHVCELHTIRKAAAASNMTQPAATKLIRELEDMFRAVLFQRNRRGMQLTAHGEILRRHIGILMADVGNAGAELDQFTRGGRGLIRLGTLPSLSSTLLSRSINSLLDAHPHVHIAMHEGTTDELLGALVRNALDVAFGRVIRADHPANLKVTKVYTEAFDIVCSKRNPIAKHPDVKWKDLAAQRWVLPELGSPLREIADSIFTARGDLRPAVAVASSSFHQMRHVISSGRLVGLLPHSMAERARTAGELVILRPRQAAKVAPISLITRSDVNPSPIVTAFERMTMETARKLGLS